MHPTTNYDVLMLRCSRAMSFDELASIALTEVHKFPDGAELVCGPITTGGLGSVELNLTAFRASIKRLLEEGRPIFDQMPYEDQIFSLTAKWKRNNPDRAREYHQPVLNGFYLPLITSGRIIGGNFMPGWETSQGARWERALMHKLGIRTTDLVD